MLEPRAGKKAEKVAHRADDDDDDAHQLEQVNRKRYAGVKVKFQLFHPLHEKSPYLT